MKLVEDWRDFPKWHSTQFAAIITAFPYAWEQMPEAWKAEVDGWGLMLISGLLFAGFLIGRVRDQDA